MEFEHLSAQKTHPQPLPGGDLIRHCYSGKLI